MHVPTVSVCLVQTVQVLPQQQAVVKVRVYNFSEQAVYIESDTYLAKEIGLVMEDVLLQPDEDGFARTMVCNPSTVPCEVQCITSLAQWSLWKTTIVLVHLRVFTVVCFSE